MSNGYSKIYKKSQSSILRQLLTDLESLILSQLKKDFEHHQESTPPRPCSRVVELESSPEYGQL